MKKTHRAVIDRLVILNFNGFQFADLDFDRTVTSFEGRNGAGKTTCMIASYLPLLPDKDFLKFKNVSENADQVKSDGGGVYDRLGSAGDISYSVLVFTLSDGSTLYAGVEIQKRPQKKYDLTPFTVRDVPQGLPAKDLLMTRDRDGDSCITGLSDLQAHIISLGATFKKYTKLTDYFAALFDFGVYPTLMTTNRDRAKFHKLMMASFYGGLTNDLQKGIKEYLLPENSEIQTAVTRARELLKEAKATMAAIDLAQTIFVQVQKIYRNAFDLIGSAHFGLKLNYEQKCVEVEQARRQYRAAKITYKETRKKEIKLQNDLEALKVQTRNTADEVEQAREAFEKHKLAYQLTQKIDERGEEVRVAREELEVAMEAREAAQQQYDALDAAFQDLREEQKQLGAALGNARRAYEEISRKVGLYNAAMRALQRARESSRAPELGAEKAKILLRKMESEVNAARECVAGLRTQYQGAEDQKRAFVPVFDALVRLNGAQPIEHRAAHSVALVILAHHREMEEAVKAAQGIDAKVNDARRNAERQKQVRVLLADLAKRDILIEDAESLLHVLEENRREISELDETVQQQIAKAYEERSEVSAQQTHIDHLNEALHKWKRAHELLAKLADAGRDGVDTSEALRNLRRDIEDERRKVEQEIDTLQQTIEQFSKQISDLQEHGASLGTNLLRAADLTGGRPMAEIYDDVAIADAAKTEARIGPLVNAIVVQDVARAAKTLSADAKQSGRGVWLVQEDKLPEIPEGDFVGEMCAVEMGVATHLSPVPQHPVLGRAAREAEVARLREEQDQKQAQQGALHQKLGELDSVIRITNDLFEYKECIGAESPEQQLNNAIDAKLRAERNVQAAERARQAAELRRVQKQDLRKQLESVNALAAFIAGVEWAEETTRLTKVMDEAARYGRILVENRIDHATLKKYLEVLRAVPVDEREMDALAKRIENLDQEITRGNALIDDLLRFEECAPNLRFADQVELEQKESGGLAAMEEQEGKLVQAIEQADKKLKQAKDTVNNKWDEFNKANSKLVEREAMISSLRGQLDELGVSADAASLEVASARFKDLKEALGSFEKGQADTIRELGGVEQKVKGQLRDLAGEGNANSVLALAQKAVKEKVRLSRDWDEFSRSMQSEDPALWIRLQDPRVIQEYIGRGSYVTIQGFGPNLRKTLGDTLTEFGAEHVLPYSTGSRSPRDYLSDWLRVRHYIEQSLPRDITQSDDLEAAMEDMRNALARMRKQQQEQETKFRTSADSIANNISSMVRREIGQINRINNDRHLSEVRFGSITGVQIDAERDERMARFLDALRIEQDLFSNTDSLEDALAFVYQRNVGGTTNGAQLLDYRRYINIKIQVRRLGQNTWDSNLGTSSGEAIGVGAAILGVILDAMERQSEALQRRKIKGSIRFLMLDEANRLDTDSLEMMGSFCENMGTQLLVAAPQIDKARSGTTFCFVRRPTESGQEVEVSYRGRRGFEVEEAT